MSVFFQNDRDAERDIVEYLGSLRPLSSNLDVTITTTRYTGVVNVRNGQVVAASQGALSGNGALFTLATQKMGTVKAQKSIIPVSHDVSVNHDQLLQVCEKLPAAASASGDREEGVLLDEAVHLFLQFRRKEAGAKLVEILRCNRFYYPAWLWHSRLVTRVDFLTKALQEMKKWGGHFAAVQKEIKKIEPHLEGRTGGLRRCVFCYAIVGENQKECANCHCQLTITSSPGRWNKGHTDLLDSLCRYEEEFYLHPENSRIAYCLCLGKFSLGDIAQARQYLDKALTIAPDELLFQKTSKVLEKAAGTKASSAPAAKIGNVSQTSSREESGAGLAAQAAKKPGVPSILVIEDSDTSRKVISLVLKRFGYTIIEATTGGEGLARVEDTTPDLVLLDVMLPDMDGYRVLSEIRSRSHIKKVPVVMLTGRRDGSDKMKGLAAGANEYLTKPFDPARLMSVLGQYVKPQQPSSPATGISPKTASPVAAPNAASLGSEKRTNSVQPASLTTRKKVAVQSASSAKGPAILVIEDSPTTRKVVTMVLGRNGFDCREAATGKDALASLQSDSFDLVLLDAMLPDMTGYDILMQMKKTEILGRVPVVMLTAKSGAVDRQRGLQAGAVAYLTKPFAPDKLLAAVKQHLSPEALATIKK